ncbi:MAG: HD domain-containing phosphohydrolase [Planctomycetota bacterium]
MGQSVSVEIWVEDVAEGSVCSKPIYDENGLLLVAARTRMTQSVIDGLLDRGIEQLRVDPDDAKTLCGGGHRKKAPVAARRRKKEDPWKAGVPVKERLIDRFDEPFDEGRAKKRKDAYTSAQKSVQDIHSKLETNQSKAMETIGVLTRHFANFLLDDHDQTLGTIGAAESDLLLTSRCVKLATMGMAVGVEMGLDGVAVSEIGVAGLLHDIGLFSMNEKFREPGVVLTDDELWEFQKHPIASQQALADLTDVSSQVQIAVEQVHEQYNGAGYPRGLQGQRIHPYARILNVVDAYLQLVTPTSRRPGIIPHDALGMILHQAQQGLFEPQVIRAFLQTETLFPLGSHVELSNGSVAQVIRRPREGYALPVLQDNQGQRIDLAQTSLEVKRPASDEGVGQVRVTPETMKSMKWSPDGQLVTL